MTLSVVYKPKTQTPTKENYNVDEFDFAFRRLYCDRHPFYNDYKPNRRQQHIRDIAKGLVENGWTWEKYKKEQKDFVRATAAKWFLDAYTTKKYFESAFDIIFLCERFCNEHKKELKEYLKELKEQSERRRERERS
jgi:hypothetical protein